MKGFFIQIKNGLLDPKHVEGIGEAVWLFLWLLDKMTIINHETGIGKVLGGKPVKFTEVQEALGISDKTYRRWVKILERGGYIQTIRAPYGLSFKVANSFKVFGQHISKGSVKNDRSKDRSETTELPDKYDRSNKTIQLDNTVIPTQSEKLTGDKGEEKQSKPFSDHHRLVYLFHDTVKNARKIKPIYTKADFSMLKRVLDKGIKPETIEQAMIFFMYDYSFRTFAPTLKTFLSAGVITGIMNRMKNEPGFWKQLDNYAAREGMNRKIEGNPIAISEMVIQLADLKKSLTSKMTIERPLEVV